MIFLEQSPLLLRALFFWFFVLSAVPFQYVFSRPQIIREAKEHDNFAQLAALFKINAKA
jgi:hypothetical protein